jgi:hypothetical protein
MGAPPGRVTKLLVRGVDLGHRPGGGPLVGWVNARNVRMMLPGKVSPGHLDSLCARVEGQPENGLWVSWHPISLPVGRPVP